MLTSVRAALAAAALGLLTVLFAPGCAVVSVQSVPRCAFPLQLPPGVKGAYLKVDRTDRGIIKTLTYGGITAGTNYIIACRISEPGVLGSVGHSRVSQAFLVGLRKTLTVQEPQGIGWAGYPALQALAVTADSRPGVTRIVHHGDQSLLVVVVARPGEPADPVRVIESLLRP
jgi:hypothetical protein